MVWTVETLGTGVVSRDVACKRVRGYRSTESVASHPFSLPKVVRVKVRAAI